MKVLFIGNSFSGDLTRYLEAVADGALFARNLYIGGCSLATHVKNMKSGEDAYDYCKDDVPLHKISIPDGLLKEKWDVISVQQVSGGSGIVESYEPYIGELLAYVKEKCPDAKLVFHKTWAYENGSDHPDFVKYNNNRSEMYERICSASAEITKKYSLPVIPSGDAVEAARKLPEFNIAEGGMPITRDGYHLSLDYGRYLIALVANKFFTGKSAVEVSFMPEGTDVKICEKLKALADTII